MELPTSLSLYKLSRVCPSLCFQFPTSPFNSHRFNHRKFRKRLNCYAKPIRVELNSEMESSAALNVNQGLENGEGNGTGYLWDDSEFVEVIGIGSRKDAVLDFCMASPFVSPSLRFWNILANNSVKVQLEQRLVGKGLELCRLALGVAQDITQLKMLWLNRSFDQNTLTIIGKG